MVPRPMYMAWDSTPRSGRPHDLGPIKPDSLQLLTYRQFGHDAGQEQDPVVERGRKGTK